MKVWPRHSSDPIRGLSLERLSQQVDAYNNGYLSEFALTAEAMEQRDDILKNVILKRKKAVARHGWDILAVDDSAEARAHQAALSYFYKNLRCTHALRQDTAGGFNLLMHQMMDAAAKGWAVHEIVWKPRQFKNEDFRFEIEKASAGTALGGEGMGNAGNYQAFANDTWSSREAANFKSSIENQKSKIAQFGLTAELRFIPLWFFENTTGRLRYLDRPFAMHGQPLAPREWLVTTGDALMVACSRAFLFKHYPLQAWLDYCQKFGTPGLRGATAAPRGSSDWSQMEAALDKFMTELAVVTNTSENIEVVDLKGRGEAPFADLVERMDRAMAALWRGADLSTLSRDRGYGASLQEQESRLLELDDAEMITGTLQMTLDRWVIEYLFGPNTTPKAYIKILIAPRECTPHDLAVDEFLVRHGAKLSLAKTMERYGRAAAEEEEDYLRMKVEG